MIVTLFATVLQLLKALYYAAQDKTFIGLLVIVVVLLTGGTLFYSGVEKWSLLDSAYFCVMTMTTIGYGDLVPTTGLSKIFTMIYAFISIGTFVSLAAKLASGLMKGHHLHIKKSIRKQ